MKKLKSPASLIHLCLFLASVHTLSVDPNDILTGNGLFNTQSTSGFVLNHGHTASFITWQNSNVLKLVKPNGGEVGYQQGLSYTFVPTNITHVEFKFASSNTDIEDTNLRIQDPNNRTLLLFRAGRGGLLRVNEKQMISFYNDSISTDSNIKLTQIDFKIIWDSKLIEIFINGKYKQKSVFFDESVGPVTMILLYNLYSSVSYWSDLVVCKSVCYDFKYGPTLGFFGLLVLVLGMVF